jgi:hypothetical protein
MPQLLYAKKLQAACMRFTEHDLIKQGMLLIEMQRRRTNKQNQAQGTRRRPALSSCYVQGSKVREEETSSPARHYTNVP